MRKGSSLEGKLVIHQIHIINSDVYNKTEEFGFPVTSIAFSIVKIHRLFIMLFLQGELLVTGI